MGVDKISDFTINLIKKFLLEYTEKFSKEYLDKKFIEKFAIKKVEFDLQNGLWIDSSFNLPFIVTKGKKEYILLVPKKILAKKETWISKNDFLENDTEIFNTIENDELRAKINKYFYDNLKIKLNKDNEPEKDYSKKSKANALAKTVWEFPDLLDYYIKFKEQKKDEALKLHIADPEYINLPHDTNVIRKEFSNKN